MSTNKAPGPDGIPSRAVKLAISSNPLAFALTYTQCLKEGIFPEHWKIQHLALIAKPGKQLMIPPRIVRSALSIRWGKCWGI